MANDNKVIIGDMIRGPFETTGRSESWAEQRSVAVSIVGQLKDIADKVKPGDSMGQFPNWFKGAFNSQYYVKNLEVSSPDGVTGELKMSLVKCGQGKFKPYNITWEVSMEEVQMRLINHPMIIENGNVETLLLWEDTQKGRRVEQKKNGELEFYYDVYDYSGGAGVSIRREQVTGDWNIAYCKAVTQGIETYNRYLPTITKNSYYLELSGANYNTDHVITGGTIQDFTGQGTIGHFDVPALKVAGFINNKDGVWFKNCDKYTSQADGSWIRTEGWVFTNDPRHMWIYTNQLEN